MNITDVRIRRIVQEGKLRAIVSISIDDTIAVHEIKVIEGSNRLFVAMPSSKDKDGVFRDIVHPITKEARAAMEDLILEKYQAYLVSHGEEA